MIKAGTNLCRVCGRTSGEHFYRSGQKKEGAKLIWDPVRKEFALEHYRSGHRTDDSDMQPHSFVLETPEKYAEGDFPPDYIQAYIDGEKSITTMYRSCPHCNTYEVLPPDMGRLVCFVIAVIGAVSAGKSAWLGALTNALDALNKQNYPYRLEPWNWNTDDEEARSTHDYEAGNTNYFLIVDVESGEAVAMVYLLDYAGELYEKQSITPDTPLGRIMLNEAGPGYNGLDGAVFIEPAVADRLNRDREGVKNVIDVIGIIRQTIRKIPVARVCTFADKLIEQVCKGDSYVETEEPPMISRKTFAKRRYADAGTEQAKFNKELSRLYEPNAIVNRVRMQDYIARNLPGCVVGNRLSAELANNRHFGHFLVQSCRHVPAEESGLTADGKENKETNDYREQFNVADPLIWMLYTLKLFPLVLKEEVDN